MLQDREVAIAIGFPLETGTQAQPAPATTAIAAYGLIYNKDQPPPNPLRTLGQSTKRNKRASRGI
jgi:hypothetical protein